MIEHALVAALRAAVPAAAVYPNQVPEGEPLPWIVYRQTDAGENDESFYAVTHTPVFEIDVAASKGLSPEHYESVKTMGGQIQDALRNGFELEGICVYNVSLDKQQDMLDNVDDLHWIRASYSLTYDTLI